MAFKMGLIGYGNMGSWHCKNVTERIDGLDVALVSHECGVAVG